MSDQDTTPPEWHKDIPEPLREAPFLRKAESVEQAVEKLAHAAQLVGTSVRIPSESSSDEDRAKFFEKLANVEGVARLPLSDDAEGFTALMGKLGLPEEAAKYELPEVKDFEWDEGMVGDLKKYAHEAGMTQRQFASFAQQIANQEMTASVTNNEALDAQRRELRMDWGDVLEDRENLIRGWMEQSGAPEETRQLLDDRKLPLASMNWLYSIAKEFKGDVTPLSKDDKGAPSMTPAEARARREQILGDMIGMRETDPRYRDLQMQLVETSRLASAN